MLAKGKSNRGLATCHSNLGNQVVGIKVKSGQSGNASVDFANLVELLGVEGFAFGLLAHGLVHDDKDFTLAGQFFG